MSEAIYLHLLRSTVINDLSVLFISPQRVVQTTPANMLAILSIFLLVAAGYLLHFFISHKRFNRIHPDPRKHQELDTAKTILNPSSNKLSFPPSRRHKLPGHTSELANLNVQHARVLPNKQPADPTTHQEHFTATGITLAECQQLGDFPDYASLSGVPLPDAYLEFDIAKALARPYRPFRWTYHQTMCEWLLVSP